jgi:uncharacterized metal-binding protein YceD (DUF177 family)
MVSARFILRIPDLESGPKVVRSAIPPEWIDEILEDTEVRHAGGPGELSLSATKSGQDVLIRGNVSVTVQVPCARTLDPAIYDLKPEIFLLLSPTRRGADKPRSEKSRPEKAGAARARPDKSRGDTAKHAETRAKPKGGRGTGGWDADPELTDEGAATDTYSGDDLVLDKFLREFILLEVPMVPLREDLRDSDFEARPRLPESQERAADPRLSPLALLKDRLEKKD